MIERILIADSLHMFRAGVRNVLEEATGFEVLEASTVAETLSTARRLRPQLVLADVALPTIGGAEVARQLRTLPGTTVILWSEAPRPETVVEGLRVGAAGFLSKEISPGGLIRALNGALAGEAALSRDLAGLVIDAMRRAGVRHGRGHVGALSDREQQVLELVSRGARNADVARELEISEFTVKRHVQNILQKLELPTRRAAAAAYREEQVRSDPGVARVLSEASS